MSRYFWCYVSFMKQQDWESILAALNVVLGFYTELLSNVEFN